MRRSTILKVGNLGVGLSALVTHLRTFRLYFFSRERVFFYFATSESDIRADVHLRFIRRALRAVPHPSFREKQNPTGPMLLKRRKRLLRMRSNFITHITWDIIKAKKRANYKNLKWDTILKKNRIRIRIWQTYIPHI